MKNLRVGLQKTSLVNFPACDREVATKAEALWGSLTPPPEARTRVHGKGRIIWDDTASPGASDAASPSMDGKWIWLPQSLTPVWLMQSAMPTKQKYLTEGLL